jgi:hypothetical protein
MRHAKTMAAAFAARGLASGFVAGLSAANLSTFLSFLCKRFYGLEGTTDVDGQ